MTPSIFSSLREKHLREESFLICKAMEQANWNLSCAARILGIGRTTLQGIIERRRHADISDQYNERKPTRGRPVKKMR